MLTAPIFTLSSDSETSALGARLAGVLQPGDTLLLEGPVGAGKSVLARAVIQTRQALHGEAEEVPSPSFTLVQTYEAGPDSLIHADLYRLTGPDDVIELGLEEAADDTILLIEWPDRWGEDTPPRHLRLRLEPDAADANVRHMSATASGTGWEPVLAALPPREAQRETFISTTDWRGATLADLAGDASNRRYFRLPGAPPAVLMDAPPEKGEDTRPFIAVTALLRSAGLSAPAIHALAPEQGFLLLEDLGDALFARVLEREPALEMDLYKAATDLLQTVRSLPTGALPPYDTATYLREARLLTDWYIPAADAPLPAPVIAEFEALITDATNTITPAGPVPVLRDYHAENLLWLPERQGDARVGLLDYQDALAGHPAYDLVSLLEDARRDTSADLRAKMLARAIANSGDDAEQFTRAYATLGAQRNIKIVGIFARLCRRDGKPAYLSLMPRVWDHLMRDLEHPALTGLKAWVLAHAPPPTQAVQARIAGQA
ncbi:tRNA (adenosine(37)-N6)-threonylcarbamoyltransferase complex ATPase subunit type 1 TsaE [Algicella marina]|uniref:tRNA (adenosine(37)-N6)-threonylcarbamoyltransferase complex ATPase subunit type 1 TsaE n=1 Tax=Algicella marina TaxID=2683284 RepID=UPI00137A27E5|nr:tRNA (adenosine(37)-N6)-threonylcarbamoyltransferase complex ATPase subunit type 1 TsaE [Algicella marina]